MTQDIYPPVRRLPMYPVANLRGTEADDPRVDQGYDEPLIAHGAGPAAPRRSLRNWYIK